MTRRQTWSAPRRVPAITWLGILSLVGHAAVATPIHVAGDGTDLFVARIEDDHLLILHRPATDEFDALRPAVRLAGRPASGGVTVAGRRLWIVYDDLRAESVRRLMSIDGTEIFRARTERRLPEALALKGVAACRQHMFALVRVTDPATLVGLDAPPPALPTDDELETGLPAPPAPAPEQAESAELPEDGVDRLVRVMRGEWRSVPLPGDWPDAREAAWLVARRPTAKRPSLFASGDDGRLRWYEPDDSGWLRFDPEIRVSGDVRVIAADGHVMLAQQPEPGAEVTVHLLRQDEPSQPIGTFSPGPGDTTWALTPLGGPHVVGMLYEDERNEIRLARMSLQGDVRSSSVLIRRAEPLWLRAIDNLVLVIALIGATVAVLVVWRRRDADQVELPESLEPAELGRRAAAAAIDLAPWFLAVYLVAGIAPLELMRQHWPGHRSGNFEAMLPGAVVIGLFALSSFLLELFTARTIGKICLGLRVSCIDGRTPDPWQILIRNAMKICEMIAWFLLILPFIKPHHQRLGDLIARTVVVAPRRDDTPPETGDRS
ncbi:MAG: hypothetical protein CMJ18_23080 [Phycisphaeraceae bacterium]|nr:hypothetical protein [Phycisphaeraceae bacterium]